MFNDIHDQNLNTIRRVKKELRNPFKKLLNSINTMVYIKTSIVP